MRRASANQRGAVGSDIFRAAFLRAPGARREAFLGFLPNIMDLRGSEGITERVG